MQARLIQTDRQTDRLRQTDRQMDGQQHDNSATIRSMNASRAKNRLQLAKAVFLTYFMLKGRGVSFVYIM